MRIITGVILGAGKGTRAYPHTKSLPKAMLDMCGRPLIYYTLEVLVEKVGVKHVILVRNSEGRMIEDDLGNGAQYGIEIEYVVNDEIDRGPAYSLLRTRDVIRGDRFVAVLGDELYLDSNHEELIGDAHKDDDIVIGVKFDGRTKEIQKNYGVTVEENRVLDVMEKPLIWTNRVFGCGTYLLTKEIFGHLERHYLKPGKRAGDMTSILKRALKQGKKVGYFELSGGYLNVNDVDDIHRARSMIRRKSMRDVKVSVIIPLEEMTHSLRDMLYALRRELPDIHEVVLSLVGPEAIDLPEELRWKVKMCQVDPILVQNDPCVIYGAAYDMGLRVCTGDLAILIPDDGSFEVEDIPKLIAYSSECDIVLGTRTTRQMIEQGANVSWLARFGNIILGKTIELLWFTRKIRLTDVGCVFRAIWKSSYELMQEGLQSKNEGYLTEMVIEGLQRRMKIIELPTSYCRRSDETMMKLKVRKVGTFLRFLLLIAKKRVERHR